MSAAPIDQDMTDLIQGMMPMAKLLGIEIVSTGEDEVQAQMEWSEEKCTTAGLLHGGAIMAFADTIGATAAFAKLPEGAGTSTIESKTNFLRGVSRGHVRAVATVLHAGRSTIVITTDVFDDDERRVARVTQTQTVLQPR